MRTPDDVMRLQRISPDDEWWSLWRDQLGGAIADDAPSGVRMDTQIAEAQAAISGAGVAVLNAMLWQGDLDAGRLVPVIDAVAYDPNDYWLVYPEHRRQSRNIKAFRDWVLEAVAQAAAGGNPDFYRRSGDQA